MHLLSSPAYVIQVGLVGKEARPLGMIEPNASAPNLLPLCSTSLQGRVEAPTHSFYDQAFCRLLSREQAQPCWLTSWLTLKTLAISSRSSSFSPAKA